MDLVLAVLHVNERAVVAIEELGIALAGLSLDGLFKDEMLVTIAGENAGIRQALNEVGITLHDRLEVYADVGVFFHKA